MEAIQDTAAQLHFSGPVVLQTGPGHLEMSFLDTKALSPQRLAYLLYSRFLIATCLPETKVLSVLLQEGKAMNTFILSKKNTAKAETQGQA